KDKRTDRKTLDDAINQFCCLGIRPNEVSLESRNFDAARINVRKEVFIFLCLVLRLQHIQSPRAPVLETTFGLKSCSLRTLLPKERPDCVPSVPWIGDVHEFPAT